MISDEQVRFWDENGYLNYGKVLEQSDVKELLDGMDRIARIEAAGRDESSSQGYGAETITQVLNIWKRDEAYNNVVRQHRSALDLDTEARKTDGGGLTVTLPPLSCILLEQAPGV
tara:strand:+ start:7721 stop:8065 length:345 start_codon:yes stop_codon:yes gene_type:complete